MQDLDKALKALPKDPIAAASVSRERRMAFPPGLVEAVAQLLFEFWERQAELDRVRRATKWENLPPKFQTAWIKITQIALEMASTVILTDAKEYLDRSNGDMGAAFARAITRYAQEILKVNL